jgi:hypothetical protein
MVISDILRIFALPVYHPVKGLQFLLKNKNRLLYSVLIFLFLGLIYTLSVQLCVMRGIVPGVDPFLKIPVNDYYYWQRFWQIAFFFVTTIVFSGVVRLLSASISGKGRFEDLFCILAVSQTLPMFVTMWLPETFNFIFFPGRNIYPAWLNVGRQVIGIIWPLVITLIGITIAEKIKWYFSVIFTLIGAIPMTVLMIIFIR